MPYEGLSLAQRIQEFGYLGYGLILFFSFIGGTVRYLTGLKGTKPTILAWLTEVFVSGFVGLMTGLTCQYYSVDPLLTLVIVGVSAHNGTRSIYLLGELLKKNQTAISATIPVSALPDQKLMAKNKEQSNDSES